MKFKSKDSGKLRIGDDWNAIRIIALSQSNPLKAIAEFVENSIDAHAKTIHHHARQGTWRALSVHQRRRRWHSPRRERPARLQIRDHPHLRFDQTPRKRRWQWFRPAGRIRHPVIDFGMLGPFG